MDHLFLDKALVKQEISIREAYDIFQNQINREDQLIISRFTWGITSNGALITVFGGIFAALNYGKIDMNQSTLHIGELVLFFFLFVIAYDVYRNTVGAIWDARRQIFEIRKVYEASWREHFERYHLPRPYGGAPFFGDLPQFYRWTEVVLPKWLPRWCRWFHGRRLLWVWTLVYPVGDDTGRRERTWWAEKILRAGMMTWALILVLTIVAVTVSNQPGTAASQAAASQSTAPAPSAGCARTSP